MKIRTLASGSLFNYVFFCDACGCAHGIRTDTWVVPEKLSDEDKEFIHGRWAFNGDLEKPTITPSIVVWSKDANGNRIAICHSFVTDGKIQYLSDCRHPLAGQTVDLPDF